MIMPGKTNEPIRSDLIARIRRQIREGVYDTPEKLDAALRKLLAELGHDAEEDDACGTRRWPPPRG